NPDVTFTGFTANFGGVAAARRFYGPRVAAWEVPTGDRGDHQALGREIATPLKEVGAYAIEASGPGVAAATILVVTDLVLAQKLHRDGILLFAANARTGQPVAGADLVVKEAWYAGNKQFAAGIRSRTGPD